MIEFIGDITLDALIDTAKLVPFLFVTYLLMEWLEHKTGSRTQALIRKAGRMGPLFGGILGAFPQCGFSAAASNLYSGGLITAGTLVAVFLSTSDEMLPIFVSHAISPVVIVKILAIKVILGFSSGFLLDFLYHNLIRKEIWYKNIHTMCEHEHCKCEEGIFSSALRHTVHITVFILLINLVLNGVMSYFETDVLREFMTGIPFVSEFVAGLVGMIPNCASSVVITQLYVEGVIGSAPMLTGLLAGAGVGLLVLCRTNKRHPKQTMGILAFVYLISVFWGCLFEFVHLENFI